MAMLEDLPEELMFNFPDIILRATSTPRYEDPHALNFDDTWQLYLELMLWCQVQRVWRNVRLESQATPEEEAFVMTHIGLLLADNPDYAGKEYWCPTRLLGGPYAFDNCEPVLAMFADAGCTKSCHFMAVRAPYPLTIATMSVPKWFKCTSGEYRRKFESREIGVPVEP